MRETTGYNSTGAQVKSRRKPRDEWLALMPDRHDGYVDWERAEAIRTMVSNNVPTSRSRGAPNMATRFWPVLSAAAAADESSPSGTPA